MEENIKKVQELLGDSEVLCQLAEECAELAKAALKLRRAHEGTNPTPISEELAALHLCEEVADVMNCLRVLQIQIDGNTIQNYQKYKLERWVKRLEAR